MKQPTGGAGSPARVFAFIFVSTYAKFELIMKVLNFDDDDDENDDERKKTKKTKFVSNDRSGHDDQKAYRIIKNGAILEG